MSSPASSRPVALVGALLVSVLLLVVGCSDDPILGPDNGKREGGGSYGVIERLAPSDSTAPSAPNPERF